MAGEFFFMANPREPLTTALFLLVGESLEEGTVYVDHARYLYAIGFKFGGGKNRSTLYKYMKEKMDCLEKKVPKELSDQLRSICGPQSKKARILITTRKFYQLDHLRESVNACISVKCDETLERHDLLVKSVNRGFYDTLSALARIQTTKETPDVVSSLFKRKELLKVFVGFSTTVPGEYLESGIPEILGLQFSLYRVSKTDTRDYYIDRWGAYNRDDGEDSRDPRPEETLYRSPHAERLFRWKPHFHSAGSKKRKKMEVDPNVAFILAIRADDLVRSGLCPRVEQAMQSITRRILGSAEPGAVSLLFPNMVKDDVVYLKTYFSDKQTDLDPAIRGFQPQRVFPIDAEHFEENGFPNQEESLDISQHAAYVRALTLLDPEDQKKVSDDMFKEMIKAKKRRRMKERVDRGDLGVLLSEDEEEVEQVCGPVRSYDETFSKRNEADLMYVEEGMNALKPYRRCNRHAFLDRKRKEVVFPKETYRLVPIWLFPLVLVECRGDFLDEVIHSDSTFTKVANELQSALSEKRNFLASVKANRSGDPFVQSPFEDVFAQQTVVEACLQMLRTTMQLNDTFRTREVNDLRHDMDRLFTFMMTKIRVLEHREHEEEQHNTLSSLGME
jgi:hypothetical protein